MKTTRQQLKSIIYNYLLLESDPSVDRSMGGPPKAPPKDYSWSKTAGDLASKVLKSFKDFVFGMPVDEIFSKWKESQKKDLISDILSDKKSFLKFDGTHLHWVSSSGNTYFKLEAGSGYEMFKDNEFIKPTSNDDPRSKMHIKGKGPAPEGVYLVGKPEANSGELRDSNSIIGACGFWVGAALKAIGRGQSYSSDWKNVDWSPMIQATWGNFRCSTKMMSVYNPGGRSGIFVHGGYDQSSAGCIDLASNSVDNMNIFGPLYTLWYEANGNINLKVDYSIYYEKAKQKNTNT